MSSNPAEERMSRDELLCRHTSISLGGIADFYLECLSLEDIQFGLSFARNNSIPYYILGGGSNTVFPDEGFRGIVLKVSVGNKEFELIDSGLRLTAGAGEIFDNLVLDSVNRQLYGLECLSGIPGSTGAVAVQNVGAYGQEVSDVIDWVDCYDLNRDSMVRISGRDCNFSYRNSIFKTDKRYIILRTSFLLRYDVQSAIKYKELDEILMQNYESKRDCITVRKAVLDLRKKKSMVLDPDDPESVSCGSFFTNPIIDEASYVALKKRMEDKNERLDTLPVYPVTGGYKVSAAFLVEHAGFPRGYRKNGIGVSSRHALALVNYGGTTGELLGLAEEIRNRVMELFGIDLTAEPILVAN